MSIVTENIHASWMVSRDTRQFPSLTGKINNSKGQQTFKNVNVYLI